MSNLGFPPPKNPRPALWWQGTFEERMERRAARRQERSRIIRYRDIWKIILDGRNDICFIGDVERNSKACST